MTSSGVKRREKFDGIHAWVAILDDPSRRRPAGRVIRLADAAFAANARERLAAGVCLAGRNRLVAATPTHGGPVHPRDLSAAVRVIFPTDLFAVLCVGKLAGERQEQTLVYLLATPLPRWVIYLAKFAAAHAVGFRLEPGGVCGARSAGRAGGLGDLSAILARDRLVQPGLYLPVSPVQRAVAAGDDRQSGLCADPGDLSWATCLASSSESPSRTTRSAWCLTAPRAWGWAPRATATQPCSCRFPATPRNWCWPAFRPAVCRRLVGVQPQRIRVRRLTSPER